MMPPGLESLPHITLFCVTQGGSEKLSDEAIEETLDKV
jgi:hypothetical protein